MADARVRRSSRDGLLDGQVCVVSGAGTGLGRETALELARLGATRGRLRPARRAAGRDRRRWPRTWRAPSSTSRSTSATRRRSSASSTACSSATAASTSSSTTPAASSSARPRRSRPKGFRTVIELNVQGTWLMTHAAATKAFIPQGGGKVLSVTLSPHNGMPGMVHSGAARAAVENMMRTLVGRVGALRDQDLRPRRRPVRDRDAADQVPEGGRRQRRSARSRSAASAREEEMAWLVAYLASPAGDFFSGTTITIDGARDNWFGPWPPGRSPRGGEPPAEERRAEGLRRAARRAIGRTASSPSSAVALDRRVVAVGGQLGGHQPRVAGPRGRRGTAAPGRPRAADVARSPVRSGDLVVGVRVAVVPGQHVGEVTARPGPWRDPTIVWRRRRRAASTERPWAMSLIPPWTITASAPRRTRRAASDLVGALAEDAAVAKLEAAVAAAAQYSYWLRRRRRSRVAARVPGRGPTAASRR